MLEYFDFVIWTIFAVSHSLPLTSSIYSANLSFEVFFFCLRQLLKNQLAKQIERAGHDDAAIFFIIISANSCHLSNGF